MMNRRDFIKHLALLAAGAAALPDQILAFEKSIELNAIDKIDKGLIFIDDIILSGMSGHSFPLYASIFTNDKPDLNFGLNLFGGIFRWVAVPGHSLRVTIPEKFIWELDGIRELPQINSDIMGGFRLVNQDGKYVFADLSTAKYEQIGDFKLRASLDTCKELIPFES